MDKFSSAASQKRLRHSRDAIVAGIFYPSTPEELNASIESLANAAPPVPRKDFPVIVSPHGSIEYSGAQAVRAWMACSGMKVDTIVIVAPSHRGFEPGIFLPESREFTVPNGSFKVDRSLFKDLAHSSTIIHVDDIPHLEELAVEMQLIFAARYFPNAKILPIIAGGIQAQEMERMFTVLSLSLESHKKSTLLVITSNMAVSEDEKDCLEKTKEFLNSMAATGESPSAPPESSRDSFCGSAILSAFMASRIGRGMVPECLGYSTSAQFADEGEPVVGYAALGFSR